jgi:uroporphyrinogen decarboxylase
LVKAISAYLIQKIKAGANAVQIFDSWAGVLSTEEFNAYSIQPTAQIVKNVKAAYPEIPIIGFPRGVGLNYQAYINGTNIDCVSCDQSVPLAAMKEFQNKTCVQGNLDNVLLLKGGEDMTDQIKHICEGLRGRPFIFNLGHGVIKETNPDNVALLVDTVRNYNK